jgi:hypothetical protein|tara:strand:+ start:610 stop:861 length:252 start_codon:yes stop_codon:yes gene_type:complete
MFDLLLVILTFSSPILIGIFISKYFKYKSELNNQLQQLRKEIDGKNVDELQNEVELLKERTEVLERIVTDSKFDLDQKISKIA